MKKWFMGVVCAVIGYGCSTPTPTPIPEPAETMLLAAVLEQGRTLRYGAVYTSSYWDDQHKDADAKGNVNETSSKQVACTIETVAKHPGAVSVSAMVCEDEALDHVFVVSPAGLWLASDASLSATALTKLLADAPLLPFPPKAKDHQEALGDPGHTLERSISANGDGWCVRESSVGGDEFWEERCFHRAGGLSFFVKGWAGGSSREAEYTLNK